MRSALRKFLDWLDRRFPEKVVMTLNDLRRLERRIEQAESNIDKLNTALGVYGPFTKAPSGMMHR